MIKKFTAEKKPKAQAMVEFALILILLLTLLYGILEAGRLLFIYASTVTAARQAVRYGSATGKNTALSPSVYYYQDCAGIRNAANRVGFLNTFSSIKIMYDRGLDSSGHPVQIPGVPLNTEACPIDSSLIHNGDRIKVEVQTNWQPIIVSLVPLQAFTIIKQSERTVLSSVSIGVTAAPGAWTGSGNISLSISASPATYSAVGQVITYTYTIRNTGAIDLIGPFTLTANNTSATCGAGSTLAPGGTLTCTGTYRIVQADLDAGNVVSLTIATASGASSGQITTTVTAAQTKSLVLAKSASSTTASSAGTPITYTYLLTNSGNVSLAPPYVISDNKIGNFTCSSTSALAPGGAISCTQVYSTTSGDMTAGLIVNTATATAQFGTTTVTSNTATATVYTSKLVLSITTSAQTATAANQVITYTYIIYNNSGVVASSPTITDSRFNVTNCPASIPSATSVTCKYDYTVTQDDMDAGGAMINQATATANSGAISSPLITTSVAIVQTPALSLAISAATNPASAGTPTVTAIGNTITFTYTLTNSGNLTLASSPTLYAVSSLVRNDTVPLTATCGIGDILPGASITCTSSMSVIANDLDGTFGPYVINHATATAKTKVSAVTVTSPQQTGTVATVNGPRLALGITANPTNAPITGTLVTFTYTLTNTGNIPLTSAYSITATKGSFNCSSATSPLAINSSTTCTGTYSTIAADTSAGSFVNTATATAINGTVTSAPASVTVSTIFLCSIKHNGSIADGSTASWGIYNNTTSVVHITSITVYWSTIGRDLKNVTLGGASVWTGTTSSSGFTITSSTPSNPVSSLTWPLALNVNIGTASTPMVLTFSGGTTGIRVFLAFSEPSCSAGLDSNNPAQKK